MIWEFAIGILVCVGGIVLGINMRKKKTSNAE
ncbi:hypothetical protein EDC19_0678 [Natranaerovirga hydrolytica]|uniref:Uncharacterized protein n=1 Tax=Natranaerovirga hydrolytica TaxID=680378 RepID=A0A4R1MY96_9FIRM|nr:hypothetical protein EDC19_0678 [Natranaerovirga hydrolytica]